MDATRIITKEYSEAVKRRTGNTDGQTIIYKTLHRKIQIEKHERFLKPVMTSGEPEV
jgi:hypothetical protein